MDRRGTIVIGVLILVAQAGLLAGYLPAVGPTSLRFLPQPGQTLVSLPPLSMGETSPLAPVSIAVPPSTPDESIPVTDTNTPLSLLPGIYPSPALTTNTPPSMTFSDTNGVPPMAPQAFLRFFNRKPGAGAGGEALVAPVDFRPANPPMPASSTATYTSPAP